MTKEKGTWQKSTKKRSLNAKEVAKEVIDKIRKGEKVNMQEIQMRHGYSVTSARSMKATRTRTYQEEIKHVIDEMSSLRNKTIKAIHGKDLTEEKLFDLNLLLKNLNHDIQLLGGGATENVSTNNIVVYGSNDFLALQLGKSKTTEDTDSSNEP